MEDNRELVANDFYPSRLEWYKAARGSGHYPLTFNFLFIRQDRHVQCSYCGVWIHERKVTKDHVYPKSLGGYIKTPCCLACNIYKADRKPIEWAVFAQKHNLDLVDDIFTERTYTRLEDEDNTGLV